MDRNRLPTILFPRGSSMNDMASSAPKKDVSLTASSLNRTPTKNNSQSKKDTTYSQGTPTPKRKRHRSARDFIEQQHIPDTLSFPNSFNEAINAAFAEEHYEAGLEMIDHSRANGIIPADHHLRILYAFALRPTPDPVTYRQTSSVFNGALSAPPSLPLVTRARILLADLAALHGPERILCALSPSKITQRGGLDAPSQASLRALAGSGDRAGSSRARGSPDSGDEEEEGDGSFLDNESSTAQLQKNSYLVPFPLTGKQTGSSSRFSLVPAVKDTWEVLRVPPPGSLSEAEILRRATASVDGDDTAVEDMTVASAQIRNVAIRMPGRRRGRGRGGSSMAAHTGSIRAPSKSDFTQEELLRCSPAALERYHETVYGKEGARDVLRTRAVNGEALTFLASLWQSERREVLYGSRRKGKNVDMPEPKLDEVNAVKALYGLSLAWDFPINKKTALAASDAARQARLYALGGKDKAQKPVEAPLVVPVAPPKPTKQHPYFAQRFATSAPSKGFIRGGSSSRGSSPPPSSQSSAGGPPSSPLGPSSGLGSSAATSHVAARVVRSGPVGCAEVGLPLDTLFEVLAGNVLLYDRDGMFRSALAHSSSKTGSDGGNGDGQLASTVALLGNGAPVLLTKWREMITAAGVALFEILQLTRQADAKTAPILDAEALERGITQRLSWADVGIDAVAGVDQSLWSCVAEEQALVSPVDIGALTAPFDWDKEPTLCWPRALVDHLKKVGSVLRQGPSRPANRAGADSGRSVSGSDAAISSQRSDRSVSLPPTSVRWEETLSKLLQYLPKSFAWMEVNRKRWMDHQKELRDDGLERFADIDVKRERRVWADLEDVEAGEDETGSETFRDIDREISEILVVRGRQPASAAPPRRRRDRSPSVLFVFEEGPAFRERSRSVSVARDESPEFEIVQVTPSKKMKDEPIVTASSSRLGGQTSSSSALPQHAVIKERRKLTGSEAIQWQTREWVLDWGLDAHHTLKSSRRPAQTIEAKAPAGATLDDHKTRLNALLRVAEVVLGEVRRRRKAALIKSAVLAWVRRCVPSVAAAAAAASSCSSSAAGATASQKSTATDDMEYDVAMQMPTSSAAASAALGSFVAASTSSSTQQQSSSLASSSPVARALLDKLDGFCSDASTSAENSLGQARVWQGAVRGVWDEAVGLGLVSTSRQRPSASQSQSQSQSQATEGMVKSELGEAVNWAFAMEMERLLKAIDIEVQGLSGTVLGWEMQALSL
ncbi:hypothetical protein OC834_002260 [Tilletia horrida]|nr:hypothetical protein OC834_002260 [Tilletia horrida]